MLTAYTRSRHHAPIKPTPSPSPRIWRQPRGAYFQRERFNHKHDAGERSIVLIGGTLTGLLTVRFVLALLGANPANGLAALIYQCSEPFVMPFVRFFSHDQAAVGAMSFQGYTLIAIFACSLLTSLITRLTTITRY